MTSKHCARSIPAALVLLLALSSAALAFPLQIKGRSVEVTTASTRPEMVQALKPLLAAEELSVDSPDRLQYDFIAVPDAGPLSLALDFNTQGRVIGVVVDAMLPEQNPVARDLAAWLDANAGPSRMVDGGKVWEHAGFRFRLEHVADEGDGSMFGFWIDLL